MGNRQSFTTTRRERHKKQKKTRQKQHQPNKQKMSHSGTLFTGPMSELQEDLWKIWCPGTFQRSEPLEKSVDVPKRQRGYNKIKHHYILVQLWQD